MQLSSMTLRFFVFMTGAIPWALALFGARDPELIVLFHSLCHQIPDRVLPILGAPMLVCSRCAGVYAGFMLGVVRPIPTRWISRAPRLMVGVFAVMALDVTTQDLGLRPAWHATRLGTGLAVGWVASAWTLATVR